MANSTIPFSEVRLTEWSMYAPFPYSPTLWFAFESREDHINYNSRFSRGRRHRQKTQVLKFLKFPTCWEPTRSPCAYIHPIERRQKDYFINSVRRYWEFGARSSHIPKNFNESWIWTNVWSLFFYLFSISWEMHSDQVSIPQGHFVPAIFRVPTMEEKIRYHLVSFDRQLGEGHPCWAMP